MRFSVMRPASCPLLPCVRHPPPPVHTPPPLPPAWRRDLSECQLAAVPPEVGLLTRLVRLDLHSNKVSTLPPSISALARLDHLSLHRCGDGGRGWEKGREREGRCGWQEQKADGQAL